MPDISERDIALLNETLTHEYFGVAAYEGAILTGLLEAPVVEIARAFQRHHGEHAAKLKALVKDAGGAPAAMKPQREYLDELPAAELTDQAAILRYALSLEKGAAIAYLNQISEFEDRDLAKIMASISGDEAMHWAVLRGALGLSPVPFAFIPNDPASTEN